MKSIRIHSPIFLLLVAVTFAAFGRLLGSEIYHGLDAQILCDAHAIARDPSRVFMHAGFYFSQPLLVMSFLVEYKAFGLDPTGFIAVNLIIHAFNAFVVYMLVNMLFPHARMALLSALLFVLGVGSYGKVFMQIHQLESLLLACFHLLVLYYFIRNDFRRKGQLLSPLFIIGLGLFLLTGLTKAASFSLIGCLLAYRAFFYKHRGRRALFSADLIVFIVVGILFYAAQYKWGHRQSLIFEASDTPTHFGWISVKNLFRYLTLMFFPIQSSPMLDRAPTWVIWIYDARQPIRFLLTLAIVSYSFFGFVFGSRAIRFFIAWTYITLLPFTSHPDSGSWLNLNHLYLTSVGFCIILAAGTSGTVRLLRRAGWRRLTPYLIPVIFVCISLGLTHKLYEQNLKKAASDKAVALRAELADTCAPDSDDAGPRPASGGFRSPALPR